MILIIPTQTIEVILTAAVTTTQLTYVVGYIDENTTTYAVSPGSSDGSTNNTNAVTVVSTPSSGNVRRMSGFSLYNGDTVAALLTVRVNDNGTNRTLWSGLLLDGDTLFYNDVWGWRIINSSGEWRVQASNITSTSSGGSSTVAPHATSHEAGGTDVIPLDTLGAPSDVTTLNATTLVHGLLRKLSGTAADNLKGDGSWSSIVAAANLTGTIASAVQDLITRLGTIASGVWNGTKIGLLYGGTNVDLSASGSSTNVLAIDGSHVISARDLVAGDIPNLAASKITSGALALARGGTNADLSATGGANQLLKQASSGAAITVGTMASTGLSDTANIARLDANQTFTGTGNTSFAGNVAVGTSFSFKWVTKSRDTVYLAASDGFVVGSINSGVDASGVDIFTDTSNPPTTGRTNVGAKAGDDIGYMCPVKQGNYYKIATAGTIIDRYGPFWVPLGTAG